MSAPRPTPPDTSPQTDQSPRLWLLRVGKAFVVFVYAVVIVNLVLLTLGFFLRLFGASTDAEFTRWVYRNVERIMEPFRGIFPSREISDVSVLDVSLLFAMIVYSIIGVALHALVAWLTGRIVEIRRRQLLSQRQGQPGSGEPPSPYAAPSGAVDRARRSYG